MAGDAAGTLLLYEHQPARGLKGDYQPRPERTGTQGDLPLSGDAPGLDPNPPAGGGDSLRQWQPPVDAGLFDAALALLGIVAEPPSRYYPEQLAVSVGETVWGSPAGSSIGC